MNVRGSIISLAGGSYCEPCVDMILCVDIIHNSFEGENSHYDLEKNTFSSYELIGYVGSQRNLAGMLTEQ